MPPRLLLLLALLLAPATSLPAAELRELAPTVVDGQVQVSFQLAGAIDDPLLARIQSGLPTGFVFEVELLRDRKHWWDDQIAGATLEVVAMYNAVSHEYLVNFKRDGKLVESRLARNRAELESAMTRFERVPLFALADLDVGRDERMLLKARAELGSKTWLAFIPVHVNTDWAESRKFRGREP
ncbi:MAG TPA: DUF4390 domain-containing protein [Thermoanaerobaculia bacterium]|jgi:hypothetical protein|nr:DUF4390 domain-containing protein [Thermoanaerobaculia bacterium]